MRTTPHRWLVAVAAALFLSLTGSAQALTLTLDESFGAEPASGYIQLTFTDAGANTVQLAMSTFGLDDPQEFVSEIYFNFDGNANILGFPDASAIAPPLTAISTADSAAFQADGDGIYNVQLDFTHAQGDRFGIDTELTMTIVAAGITADDFNVLAAVGGGNGPYFAAAHIQGTGGDGEGSDWLGANGGPPVPEPMSAVAFGVGVLLFAGAIRRNRR